MALTESERKECNNSALFSHGTGYIFELRSKPLKIATKILSFSSLAGPLIIGALVIALGTEGELVVWALVLASIASFIQIIVTLWSVVAGWQKNISSYEEAMVENYYLSTEFKTLANSTNLSDTKWRTQLSILNSRGELRRKEDLKLGISEEERRMAMRYSLRFFSRPCAACKQVPTSILPHTNDNCTVCADFKIRKYIWLT
jgi:mobilome CxxCx(11)CxxC protein